MSNGHLVHHLLYTFVLALGKWNINIISRERLNRDLPDQFCGRAVSSTARSTNNPLTTLHR